MGDPVPELIPVRVLNEFVYCPRLAYLMWVQGEWAENEYTHEGQYVHRRVDKESGRVPYEVDENFQTRSLTVSCETLGLIAKLDLLEGTEDGVTPIDYKRGSPPQGREYLAHDPERVQLCAQGLLLRANGFACHRGYLYFAESRQRVKVEFDEELVEQTLESAHRLRAQLAGTTIPPPLVHSPKCVGCSLAPICLPDEVNLFRLGDKTTTTRRLVPLRDDAVPLYVQHQGTSVGITGETLEVKSKGEKIGAARLIDVSQLCVIGNVQVSTQAIRALTEREIPICYFTYGGWFSAMTMGLGHKNVMLRERQFACAADKQTALVLARRIVAAKIRNCRTMLRRNCRDLDKSVLDELRRLGLATQSAVDLDSLFGIEGMAARHYFAHFVGMLKPRLSGTIRDFDFNGRNRRPPKDPINALLSFLYAVLTKDLTVIAQSTGFDPYQGFYHQNRYGRPSLALDLIEEFRPIVADSVVLSVLNNGIVGPEDFVITRLGVALKPHARRAVTQAYERRLEEAISHPLFEYRISYRRILYVQTRLLARFLLGEIEEFPAFVTR